MSFERLTLTIEENIAHLQLNRPQAHNSIDSVFAAELRAAALQLHGDPRVRAILLTAHGKNFSVGGDLKAFSENAREVRYSRAREVLGDLHAGVSLLTDHGAPFIAAVHGAVAGAGLSLSCAADVTIASSDSRFTMAYTAVGLTPDAGSTYYLTRLIGYKRALDLTLTNRMVGAKEALEYGLVSRVVEPADLLTEARALAAQLAKGPTATFRATKRLFRQGWESGFENQLENEARAFATAMTTNDTDEGMRAFLEKRTPVYKGI